MAYFWRSLFCSPSILPLKLSQEVSLSQVELVDCCISLNQSSIPNNRLVQINSFQELVMQHVYACSVVSDSSKFSSVIPLTIPDHHFILFSFLFDSHSICTYTIRIIFIVFIIVRMFSVQIIEKKRLLLVSWCQAQHLTQSRHSEYRLN